MESRYDYEMMVRVAQMYYIDSLKQDKIAKLVNLSRSTVCMILADARENGIVEIKVKNAASNNVEISNELLRRFKLLKCFVIPTSITAINTLTQVVASQGASLAEREMKSHSIVGVAWGSTIHEFMKSFANQNSLADIQVVPLIGGTNRTDSEYQLNEMVRILAEKLHGNPTFIYAPAYTESVKDRELYMKSASMQLIEDKWSALDVAVVSVGAMPEFYDSYDSKVLLDPFVVKTVFEKDPDRAVGDICGRWFNIKGNFLKNEHNKQLIAIDEDKLAAVPKVICIASGNHKVLSLVGALRSKTIDILITDENTAKSVLDVSNI